MIYKALQVNRMSTGIEEMCSILLRTVLPKTTRFTIRIEGTMVALSRSKARIWILTKLNRFSSPYIMRKPSISSFIICVPASNVPPSPSKTHCQD